MKKLLLSALFLASGIAAMAQVDTITGPITTNTTLSATTIHILKGTVYVKNNATLTIEAGSLIKGDKASKGTLVITRGSKLVADGTDALPIVFTSDVAAGSRNYGDWGGIVILGNAVTNQPTTKSIEGLDATNPDNQYGGTNDLDSSGRLSHIRIEFAGIALAPNNEINGLTFGGVGSKTFVDRIQVSYSGDDSYEFFGGTVNAKHLFAFRTTDDNFDFDFGYRGKIQYGCSLIDPAVADAAGSSNGIECDNDGTGDVTKVPNTNPILEGFTIIGNNAAAGSSTFIGRATHFRRASKFSLRNSVIIGYKNGINLDSDSTNSYLNNKRGSFYQNNLIDGSKPYYSTSNNKTADSTSFRNYTAASENADTVMTSAAAAGLTNPFDLVAPNFMPTTTSRANKGANYAGADAFFDVRQYRGAFGSVNWLSPWGNFTPQTTDYSKPFVINSVRNNAVAGFNVYPNPANTVVNVKFNTLSTTDVVVNVLDITGKLVANKNLSSQNGNINVTFSTEEMVNGTYFVQVITNAGVSTSKLIVVR